MSDRVKKIMANVLAVSEDRIAPDATQKTLSEWTSLNHLRLITELEAAFGVEVSMDDAMSLDTFDKLVAKFGD